MNESIKNLLIGVFILFGIGLIVFTVFFLKPSVGDMKQTIYVRFSDINQISVGTRVMFAGKQVGEVTAINQIPNAREQPTDALGRVYFYQLTLKLDSGVKLYNTDEITLQTSGLLGEKSIALIPKAPPKGITPIRITDQPVYAESVDPIENALLEFSEMAGNIEEAFKEITNWIKGHGEDVADAINAFKRTMFETEKIASDINQEHLVACLKLGINEVNTLLEKINDAMDTLEQKDTFTHVGDMSRDLKEGIASFNIAMTNIAQGKGTIGKLVEKDDLYLQAVALLSKANTLMNDLNQYGLLFHQNKSWQRTHSQKMQQLASLCSPSDFRRYFQNEVDQINDAMMRLSLMIERAEDKYCNMNILRDTQFKKDFADLLKKAEILSEQLRLYNQQLMEIQCE